MDNLYFNLIIGSTTVLFTAPHGQTKATSAVGCRDRRSKEKAPRRYNSTYNPCCHKDYGVQLQDLSLIAFTRQSSDVDMEGSIRALLGLCVQLITTTQTLYLRNYLNGLANQAKCEAVSLLGFSE